MSYNVDQAEYLGEGKLQISRKDAKELLHKYKDNLPECHFLDNLNLDGPNEEEMLTIEDPEWHGEFSGIAYQECLMEILKKTTGKAVIVFTWEGGDSTTALSVKDGVVKEKEVKLSVEED